MLCCARRVRTRRGAPARETAIRLRYWLQLAPFAGRLKAALRASLEAVRLDDRAVSLGAGNLYAVAYKPAADGLWRERAPISTARRTNPRARDAGMSLSGAPRRPLEGIGERRDGN